MRDFPPTRVENDHKDTGYAKHEARLRHEKSKTIADTVGQPQERDKQFSEKVNLETTLHAFDAVNGVTYMGKMADEHTIRDYVAVPTTSLITKNRNYVKAIQTVYQDNEKEPGELEINLTYIVATQKITLRQ